MRAIRKWTRAGFVLIVLGAAATVLVSATSVTAASTSTKCTLAPNPSSNGYWTPFGDGAWTGNGLVTTSAADAAQPTGVTCGGASIYGTALPTTDPRGVTALSFDFAPDRSGPSGDSPRLVVCFSDATNCNSNGYLAVSQWTAGFFTHVDGLTSSAWANKGGSCPAAINLTFSQLIACHRGATITQVAVVNDSGSYYHAGETVLFNNFTFNNIVAHATPPVMGKTATVVPSSGSVEVMRPGAHHFSTVKTVSSLPYGTVVNASKGNLQVIAAEHGNTTESGQFYDGSFMLAQLPGGVVQATLTDRPKGCPEVFAPATATSAPKFQLWGHVKGKYRTRGHYGSASVQGTIWLTVETCDGTFFRVVEGVLTIRDFTRHKTVIVRAGHSYLARRPIPVRPDPFDHDGDDDSNLIHGG